MVKTHTGPVESDFLFMEAVLIEKKIFLNKKNFAGFMDGRVIFEKLIRKYKGNRIHVVRVKCLVCLCQLANHSFKYIAVKG